MLDILRSVLILTLLCSAGHAAAKEEGAKMTVDKPASEAEEKAAYADWKSSIDIYVEAQLLRKSLINVEQGLEHPETAPTRSAAQLKEEKRKLAAKLQALNAKRIADIEYYLAPQDEGIAVDDRMYLTYGRFPAALETYKQQLSQQQIDLAAQIKEGKGDVQIDAQLEKVSFSLDTITKIQERLRNLSDLRLSKVNELKSQLADVDEELSRNSIWQKSYTAYLTYVDVKRNLLQLQKQIDTINASRNHAGKSVLLDTLISKQKILSDQLSLLQSHSSSPFADLLKPDEIEEIPAIINPLDIFSGVSYNKKINEQLKDYSRRADELRGYLQMLLQKRHMFETLSEIDPTINYVKKIQPLDAMIEKYQVALTTMQETENVYAKRIEEVELKVNKAIGEQLSKLVKIGGIILFLLIIFFVMKQIAKKYISDNERFYMANKVLTFGNVSLIILVLLFNYIENVSYIVTVLGFASAGIAIAMKDWFMSMLGWLVIVFGGSIHVGNRIRVDMDGLQYVGDVLDISMLRITILEDITLTTYTHNRRAGRIIFIPNNYIFTHMIANYTHVSLKTVWDGIDITITFDSNHKKAAHLAKEVTRKFAKGYTDITRKQLNKLRSRYNLKNTNVEPRIYEFAEENGIRISAWYLTNAYATLTLRSTISMEILDAFAKEDDITIAYPTQRLRLQNEPLPQPVRRNSDEDEPPV